MSTPSATTSSHTFAHALSQRAALRSDQRLNAVNEVRAATIGALCSADCAVLQAQLPMAKAPRANGGRLVARLPTDAEAALQIAAALVEGGPRGAAQISTEMLSLNHAPAWHHAALASLLAFTPPPEHPALVAALVPTAAELATLRKVLPWAKHVRFARADGPLPDLLLSVAAKEPAALKPTVHLQEPLPQPAQLEAARALLSPLLAMFQDPVWNAAFLPAVERAAITLETRSSVGQHVRPEFGGQYTDGSATLDYYGLRMIVTLIPGALTLDIPIDEAAERLWPDRAWHTGPPARVEAKLLCARAADPTVAFAERINILTLASSQMGKALFVPRSDPSFYPPFLQLLNADAHVAALGGVREMNVTYRRYRNVAGDVLRLNFNPATAAAASKT